MRQILKVKSITPHPPSLIKTTRTEVLHKNVSHGCHMEQQLYIVNKNHKTFLQTTRAGLNL